MRALVVPDAPLLPVERMPLSLETLLGPLDVRLSFPTGPLARAFLNGDLCLNRIDYRLKLQFCQEELDGPFHATTRSLRRIGGFENPTSAAIQIVVEAEPEIGAQQVGSFRFSSWRWRTALSDEQGRLRPNRRRQQAQHAANGN